MRPGSRSGFRHALFLAPCLVLGGLLRFYHALQLYAAWNPPDDRGEGYFEGAINFLSFHVLSADIPSLYAESLRGPLYPSFIVLLESLFTAPLPGHVRLVQAGLSVLMIAAGYGLASRLVSPWAGFLAALLIALDYEQIKAVGSLDLNAYYSACMLALAAMLARWAVNPSPRNGVALAVLLTASYLCRTSHFLIVPLICAAAFFWWGAKRPTVKRLCLLLGVSGALMLPYLIRNAAHFKKFVALDAGSGSYRLYAAAIGERNCCDDAQLAEYRRAAIEGAGLSYRPSTQETEPLIIRHALRTVLADPRPFAVSFLLSMAYFWAPYALLLLLAARGSWRDRRNRGLQAVWLVLASFLGYHVMITNDWHSFVVRPLVLIVFACASAEFAAVRLKLRQRLPSAPHALPAAETALAAVFAVSLAGVFYICAAEGLLRGKPPEPGRGLALLNLSVVSTGERYGLAARGQFYSYLGRRQEARRDFLRARALGQTFPYIVPGEARPGPNIVPGQARPGPFPQRSELGTPRAPGR